MDNVKITIKNNGSIFIEGPVDIYDADGGQYGLGGREAVSLCRCGLSENKPFCDGRHKSAFTHTSIAMGLPPKK